MDRFDLYRAENEIIDPPVILCENVTKDYVDPDPYIGWLE